MHVSDLEPIDQIPHKIFHKNRFYLNLINDYIPCVILIILNVPRLFFLKGLVHYFVKSIYYFGDRKDSQWVSASS